MPSIFREPVAVTYVDESEAELAVTVLGDVLPRVGENIRIGKTPYVVVRVGHDMPERTITQIWVVCRPA